MQLPGSEYQEYLGDGVYASWDGYQIWLATSDGERVTNRIALEASVLSAFDMYQKRLGEQLEMAVVEEIEKGSTREPGSDQVNRAGGSDTS